MKFTNEQLEQIRMIIRQELNKDKYILVDEIKWPSGTMITRSREDFKDIKDCSVKKS